MIQSDNIQNLGWAVTCHGKPKDKPTRGTLIRGPAWDPIHIGLSCSQRIWAEGPPCTGFTLAGRCTSRKGPLGACWAKDGGAGPTAPVTRWAGTVGVVCQACKTI